MRWVIESNTQVHQNSLLKISHNINTTEAISFSSDIHFWTGLILLCYVVSDLTEDSETAASL